MVRERCGMFFHWWVRLKPFGDRREDENSKQICQSMMAGSIVIWMRALFAQHRLVGYARLNGTIQWVWQESGRNLRSARVPQREFNSEHVASSAHIASGASESWPPNGAADPECLVIRGTRSISANQRCSPVDTYGKCATWGGYDYDLIVSKPSTKQVKSRNKSR